MRSLIVLVIFMILCEPYQTYGQGVIQQGGGGRRGNDRDNGRNNRGRQNCRSGETAVGYCSWSGRCSIPSAYCRNQLCCAPTGVPFTTTSSPISFFCPTGQREVGPCINGGCQNGATCTNGRCCAPNVGVGICPGGVNAIGPCINNACPPVATCVNNMCCAFNG